MASTSTSFSCNTEREPENEHTSAFEEIVSSPSTSATPSVGTLFSSCFNWCSFFLSLCSTPRHFNACQEIVPSPSNTHAFEQVVPPTAFSVRSTMPDRKLPYDVFINHRGSDVKHTLAATLYKTLTHMALRVFLDNEKLEHGDFLPTEIEEAMRSASLHIAIFSPNYAQSPWCLAELSFMLKTGTPIIPVFYLVQPDDVRYAKGVFAGAFSRHKEKARYTLEKLQEWKNALNSVSYNFGDIVHNDRDEGTLLKKIVFSVSKVIKNRPFVVANYPIGLDETLTEFERTALQSAKSQDNVQIVGIWGMGGSGKTTLAKHLYNNKCKFMDKSSFLFDIRDASSNRQLHKKQEKFLKDLLGIEVSIENIEEGMGILANRLRSIRLLIILDDVDSVDQLNALVPKKDSFGWGSLIVVTSREFEVLRSWGISSIYKMKALDRPHAKQLFCWHAFLQPSPHQAFEDLVEKFLNVCHGLPLSLKVFGAQLYGISNKDYWEIQLQKISRILPKDIKDRLKVSYDALDDEEKQIFLDIACFFIGEKINSAIAAWDGSGWNGQHSWERLLNKCLVELNDDGFKNDCIRMHDHLRDLGREIANHQSPYRLWSPQQIINIGNQVKGIAIRGIMVTTEEFRSQNEEFPRCSQDGKLIVKASGVNYSLEPSLLGLKNFHVRGSYYNQVIGDLSRELVWLRWHGIKQTNLRSLRSLKNLRVLELYGGWQGEDHLDELWETQSNAPVQLRELVINKCSEFRGFPKSIGCLRHLKKIVVTGWNKVRSLPEDFCLLQSLEHLKLNGCEGLLSLPNNFGDLRNLRNFKLSNCTALRRLPVSFKELRLLQYLTLTRCDELTLESDILENMTRLEHFVVWFCHRLEELPRHITNQSSLTNLECFSDSLREVPVNIGRLRKLQRMKIGWAFMTSLPTSFGDLSSLTYLMISDCREQSSLPNNFGDLRNLRNFTLSNSRALRRLPVSFKKLTLLQYLTLTECSELTLESDILENITRLEHLVILGCHQLEELPRHITNQSSLTKLVCFSERLREVPVNIGRLRKLQRMEIVSPLMTSLPTSFGDLSSLTYLLISNFRELKCLPQSVWQLNNLQTLKIWSCPISELNLGAGLSTCLEELELSNNSHLKDIEVLPNTLKRIHLQECPKLDVLPNFAELGCLHEFELVGCYGVKRIQGLEHCRELEMLIAHTRWEESAIESLEGMERLRRVELKAISRSGVEGCIQSMKRWPKEEIIVCTRAVPDAATLLNSFDFFPNLSVVDSFSNQKMYSDPSLKWPSAARCILLCFVMNCESPKTSLCLSHSELNGKITFTLAKYWPTELEEGKWIWTALLTQHSDFHSGISGLTQSLVHITRHSSQRQSLSHIVRDSDYGHTRLPRGFKYDEFEGEVEKGLLVMGEEERVWEAFTRLFDLLSI